MEPYTYSIKKLFIVSTIVLICFQNSAQKVKIFGHRGCKGLLPENTIISFKKALDLGVDGIEWDVVVSKDNELIISHEPYIDTNYCKKINADNKAHSSDDLNIYKMSTKEVKSFDCGSSFVKNYPDQKLSFQTKPTVKEAFNELKKYNPIILFEIKSSEKNYGFYQPYPEEYAEIITKEIKGYEHIENILFMSFDPELLNSLNKLMPNQKYILLNYNPLNNFEKCLSFLKFKPYAIGLYFPLINTETINKSHANNIQVFAWTVNDIKIGDELKTLGVDGIISDYPNLFLK